jgi:hypothetical protein
MQYVLKQAELAAERPRAVGLPVQWSTFFLNFLGMTRCEAYFLSHLLPNFGHGIAHELISQPSQVSGLCFVRFARISTRCVFFLPHIDTGSAWLRFYSRNSL